MVAGGHLAEHSGAKTADVYQMIIVARHVSRITSLLQAPGFGSAVCLAMVMTLLSSSLQGQFSGWEAP